MALPVVRSDSLPDGATYTDDGCSLSKSCLSCPLARCRYDGGNVIAEQKKSDARALARELTIDEIAAAVGRSRRSVFRYLEENDG